MPHAVYQGAIFHTMYRDGIHVVFTRDVEETAEWLAALAKKVFEKPDGFIAGVPASPASALAPTVARRKIASINPAVCYRLQLCQIPTISNKIATEIAKAYPTWEALWGALHPLPPAQRVAELMKLPMVGRKKAEAIVGMLWVPPAAPAPA
jgi:ERCC4-type nuclease